MPQPTQLEQRLHHLETHLAQENPILLPVVASFRKLDEADEEGRRIDAYLQLKTCPSEPIRGKIVIDSPPLRTPPAQTNQVRVRRHRASPRYKHPLRTCQISHSVGLSPSENVVIKAPDAA